ncbi:hypothetical protein [Streptomyces sp. NPDC088254]
MTTTDWPGSMVGPSISTGSVVTRAKSANTEGLMRMSSATNEG